MNSRLKKLYKFSEEIEKLKHVERSIYLSGLKRKEADSDHMWHMALMLILFAKDFGFKFDVLKTMKIILIHDLPEIYAGDTFLFDDKGRRTKEDRETKAANKLFRMLPPDLGREFHELFNEYNNAISPEARAARILDTIQPGIQGILSKGKVWRDNKITVAQARKAKAKEIESMKGTPMYEITMNILKEAKRKGYMK